MWFLERKKDRKTVYLLCNNEYTVGRKNCTIVISEDASVSRKHLTLKVGDSSANESRRPILQIKDLSSTYGTYINPTSTTNTGKIEANVWVTVTKESTLHFGIENEWLIKWNEITILCSAMSPTSRGRLSIQLAKLGAKHSSDWNATVTHLIMERIVFTQKVMQCLISGIPIVNIDFFETWTRELDLDPTKEAPDVASHIPPLDSQLIHIDKCLFLPKKERSQIFTGKKFIFPTIEQYESMRQAVTAAGGTAVHSFDDEEGILIEYPSGTPPKEYMLMFNLHKKLGRRVIPMKDIGLAVLHCSTERHCNQFFSLEQTLFQNKSTTVTNTNPTILAPETQHPQSLMKKPDHVDDTTKGLQESSMKISSVIKEEPVEVSCTQNDSGNQVRHKALKEQVMQEIGPSKPPQKLSKRQLPPESQPAPLSKKARLSTFEAPVLVSESVESARSTGKLDSNLEPLLKKKSSIPQHDVMPESSGIPTPKTVQIVKTVSSKDQKVSALQESTGSINPEISKNGSRSEFLKPAKPTKRSASPTDEPKSKKPTPCVPARAEETLSAKKVKKDIAGISNTEKWDLSSFKAKSFSLSESFGKLAVRTNLLRPDHKRISLNVDKAEQRKRDLVPRPRIHNMRTAYLKSGQWCVESKPSNVQLE